MPIDTEFLQDSFNLYGLRSYARYRECLQLIRGPAPVTDGAGLASPLLARACVLLAAIHARFLATHRGLQLMERRFEEAAFGECPRALCRGTPVLPIGGSEHGAGEVELYCPCCAERYAPPRGTPEAQLDGAFFGPTFAPLLLVSRPNLRPRRARAAPRPAVFGFKVAEHALYREDGEGEEEEELEEEGRVSGAAAGGGGGGGGRVPVVWRRSGLPLTSPWPDWERRPPADDFYSDDDDPPPAAPPKVSGVKRGLF